MASGQLEIERPANSCKRNFNKCQHCFGGGTARIVEKTTRATKAVRIPKIRSTKVAACGAPLQPGVSGCSIRPKVLDVGGSKTKLTKHPVQGGGVPAAESQQKKRRKKKQCLARLSVNGSLLPSAYLQRDIPDRTRHQTVCTCAPKDPSSASLLTPGECRGP